MTEETPSSALLSSSGTATDDALSVTSDNASPSAPFGGRGHGEKGPEWTPAFHHVDAPSSTATYRQSLQQKEGAGQVTVEDAPTYHREAPRMCLTSFQRSTAARSNGARPQVPPHGDGCPSLRQPPSSVPHAHAHTQSVPNANLAHSAEIIRRIVSVAVVGQRIGIATLDAAHHVISATSLYNHPTMMRSAMYSTHPRIIICPESLRGSRHEHLMIETSQEDAVRMWMPDSCFAPEAGLALLTQSRIQGIGQLSDDAWRWWLMSRGIDVQQKSICSAMGGLLSHILGPGAAPHERTIRQARHLQLRGYVSVDPSCLSTLPLVPPDRCDRRRQLQMGVSLFHILNRTMTRTGQHTLRCWIEHPSRDIQGVLRKRHDFIHFVQAIAPSRSIEAIKTCLRGMKDATVLSRRIKSYTMTQGAWKVRKRNVTYLPGLFLGNSFAPSRRLCRMT